MARSKRVSNWARFRLFAVPAWPRCFSSLVGHGDTFPDRKNDPDGDSSEFDYFIEVGQVWKIANAALSQSISWSKFGIQFAFFIELSSSDPNTCQNNQTQPT